MCNILTDSREHASFQPTHPIPFYTGNLQVCINRWLWETDRTSCHLSNCSVIKLATAIHNNPLDTQHSMNINDATTFHNTHSTGENVYQCNLNLYWCIPYHCLNASQYWWCGTPPYLTATHIFCDMLDMYKF